MVEYQDGVILIGGSRNPDPYNANLYQLSSPTGAWTKMEQTFYGTLHVSFLVPDELVHCHY
jgi:hypothetical protein